MTRSFAVDWKASDLHRTEATLERDILEYLHKAGYWARQTHSGKRKPVGKGMLDIVFGCRSRWGCIEVKTDRGKPTAEQWEEILRIRAAGGVAIVVRSVEDVMGRMGGVK